MFCFFRKLPFLKTLGAWPIIHLDCGAKWFPITSTQSFVEMHVSLIVVSHVAWISTYFSLSLALLLLQLKDVLFLFQPATFALFTCKKRQKLLFICNSQAFIVCFQIKWFGKLCFLKIDFQWSAYTGRHITWLTSRKSVCPGVTRRRLMPVMHNLRPSTFIPFAAVYPAPYTWSRS